MRISMDLIAVMRQEPIQHLRNLDLMSSVFRGGVYNQTAIPTGQSVGSIKRGDDNSWVRVVACCASIKVEKNWWRKARDGVVVERAGTGRKEKLCGVGGEDHDHG